MAILDNFEVTILTPTRPTSLETLEPSGWVAVREYEPPGDDGETLMCTRRKYIGVPPLRTLESIDRVSTEFVIDYKVKCGFTYVDQNDTGVEYIVFRTWLDGDRIGSASVKRSRWERSGTYRVRKQGKRYRVEHDQSWIRQKWMFDPGLHGTIRVEVWRERTKAPTDNDWFIDLTRDEELTVGQEDLFNIAYEANAKRPRVKNLVKMDPLPLATFEFEYRSEATLQLLGLTEPCAPTPDLQRATDNSFTQENDDLWRTMTGTSSSGGTVDTIMDSLLSDMDLQSENFEIPYAPASTLHTLPPVSYVDAIGRSLLTGLNVPGGTILPPIARPIPLTNLSQDCERTDAVPVLEDRWWSEFDAPIKTEISPRHDKLELVDLTMLD